MVDTPIAELEARLESVGTEPADPVRRIDALNELAWALRARDIPRANALAAEARELAFKHEYKLGQARAARTMAMSIHDAEGLRRIFSLAQEAKQLFDEVDDGPGRAASRDFLASLCEFIGDLSGGLELALDALSIARDLGDPIRQGYALSSVGGILAASGEPETAVERLKEALALFEQAQVPDGVGTICSRLAKVLKSAGRSEEALFYAQRCRDVADKIEDGSLLFLNGLTVMAELADERGHLEEAERLYRAALDSIPTAQSRSLLGAEARVALGRLLIRRGALGDAEHELLSVLSGVEGDTVSIMAETAANEALAELREQQGKLADAIKHLRVAQALRERIAQQDARNKLAQVEMRAAMEAAKKDAEIQKLRFVELHGMQSKLVEAEKMAILGKLAAGTAHELNTPLGVLRGNTDMSGTAVKRFVGLLRDSGELGEQVTKLAAVLDACAASSAQAMERIATIAQSFKRFTQLDQAELRSFDVSEGIESALALLGPTIPEQITLERHLGQTPPIEGWPREVNHAFMTVLQNAVQAIDGAGVVATETGVSETHVLVRIRDTGRGMSEQQVAHLFDVTWSGDGPRTMMRMGLSASYTTMQKHGGDMEVQSVLGEGTTVTFRFPIPPASDT